MAIIYRNNGAWGTGKGARLTSLEGDGNFYDHEQRINELESVAAVGGIHEITVIGNQLTIEMTDGSTFGPFSLQNATWTWRGEWLPATVYLSGDIISYEGALYLVLTNHTSEASFDGDAEDVNGLRYSNILSAPGQPYDIGLYSGETIPTDGELFMLHVASRSFVISDNFGQSVAYLNVPCEHDLELAIYRNYERIGTLLFEVGTDVISPAGQYGTFLPMSPNEEIQFTRFDLLRIMAPLTPYTTPAGLAITLCGRTGTVS